MRLSVYLKSWPYPAAPGHHLLYSTRTAALALVPDPVLTKLAAGGQVDQEFIDTLTPLGMLVADQDAERAMVRNMLDELNHINPTLTVAVILGMECNFACPYCYEGSMKGRYAMDDAVADQLVVFLKDLFVRRKKKKMTLDFYGGEPLLYLGRIISLAGQLKPFVEEQGGEFSFYLVTNGSLLTRKRVARMGPLGLATAKVTVDGPAAIHNVQRPFRSGRESFNLVLDNIAACCDQVRIGIGGNFTRDNFREFPLLLDELAARGLTADKLRQVKFDPVMQITDTFANPEFRAGCSSYSDPWVGQAFFYLRDKIMAQGYSTPKMSPAACMVDQEDTFTVHYNGEIYKCPSMIGHDGYQAGDIFQGLGDYRGAYHLDHWQQEEKCRQCVYLPLCFGGCRYLKLQRDGDMDGVDCRQPFLDSALEEMLRQDIRYRKPEDRGQKTEDR
ncbi:MAG: geopeptide radical SAM maturase [Desulfobacterales bacterium]|nr:geopeptide radical SAM maturase [Desulfobacterales bacterium]